MKHLYLDLETTGLYSSKHAILQLACILVEPSKPDRTFTCSMKPFDGALIEDRALEVNGHTRASANSLPDWLLGYRDFIAFLNTSVDKYDPKDKLHLTGYNIKFDEDFLRALFRRADNRNFASYFWTPSQCVMTLAARKLQHLRPTLPDFKLKTVANHLGISFQAHDALADIQATREIDLRLSHDPQTPQA